MILGVGTRFADFTTGSWALFKNPDRRFIGLNVQPFDAVKHRALPVVGDARVALAALDSALGAWKAPRAWGDAAVKAKAEWEATAARYTAPTNAPAPTDAEVLGALMRAGETSDVVVCAAGGLPGELHKLWRPGAALGYHVEYGYSCMGYEIAGGLGVKMALPEREVVVTVGDGSYLMMNSEIATSVMLGVKLIIVVLDNRGFGCINRLQKATGGAPFNNLLARRAPRDAAGRRFRRPRARDGGGGGQGQFDRRARDGVQGGARGEVDAGHRHRHRSGMGSTDAGGFWWDVAVPAVSERAEVGAARRGYEDALKLQRVGD